MFGRKRVTTCPHCGAKVEAEAVFCRSCQRGLTGAVRAGKPKSFSGWPGLASNLALAAGIVFFFLFTPVGIALLILSAVLRRVGTTVVRGKCPYCNKETVAFPRLVSARRPAGPGTPETVPGTGAGDAVFTCIRCKRKITIDRSSGTPVFVQHS